jgi:hypothetical protein
MSVGDIMPGKIDPSQTNQKQHPIHLDTLPMKYLFIKLATLDTNLAAIGFYSK